MWVKICANTSREDALAAAEFGADALGFVFAPSTRRVTAESIGPISTHLDNLYPHVERIGVFQSTNPSEIVKIAETARLTGIQLHGDFDLRLAGQLRNLLGPAVTLIHVLHFDALHPETLPPASLGALADQLLQIAAAGITDRVLIDSKVGVLSGGTGVTFDWSAATPIFADAPKALKLTVAGGLGPRNVAQAIQELHPWGVDVASGVERAPGEKDEVLVRSFIQNARQPAR